MNHDEAGENPLEVVEANLQGPLAMVPFRLFKTDACFQVANDIFSGATYPVVPFVANVNTILDVGANIGAASVYLATAYPQAQVYAVEPGCLSLSLLRQNTEPFSNIRVFPVGLYSSEETSVLFPGKNDGVESSICSTARTTDQGEPIHLVRASHFLSQQGITAVDILKVDTEGCEVPILKSLIEYLPEVKVLYVEYHSERDRRMIDEMLAETHILWSGHIKFAYRGEFCYVKRELVPDENQTHSCEIPPHWTEREPSCL